MASVRISELPLVTGINNTDVIVINEQNVISSGITLLDFTTGFLAQDLQITGDATFHGEVEFNNDLEVNGETSFNNIVTFEEPVVFKNAITIENFTGVDLDSLGDVELNNPQHLDTLVYNAPFQRWENDGDTYLRNVVQDTDPHLGGALDTNNQPIISTGSNSLEFVSNTGVLNFRSGSSNSAILRIYTESRSDFINLTVPQSGALFAPYTLVLPVDTGTVGQVLATDGAGRLYWTTNQGSGGGGGGGGTGGGIELTDLSVQVLSPNAGGNLTYNPGTGIFYFNPADVAGFIEDITSEELGDLQDVNVAGIQTGQTIIYDGSTKTYVPGDASITNKSISDLNDVDTTGVQDGDYLVYNQADGEWKAESLSIANAIVYKGVCDVTKPISDSANDNVDPATNAAGHFWINIDTATGAIHPDWVGLTGNALGLEYVVYTPNDEYYFLGQTGDLSGIIEVQAGDGIGVDVTPDATRPTVFLEDTGVVAGDYAYPFVTVNDKGQITYIEELDVDDVGIEISVGVNPHDPAKEGDLWVTENYELYVYDGSWVQVSGGAGDFEIDLPSYPSLP